MSPAAALGAEDGWGRVEHGRLPRLDGLRAIAITAVIVYHLGRYDLGRTVLDETVLTFAGMGWAGVDLFFVLSGFLITGILLRTREAPARGRTFYARRFLRIFPLYYAVLALFLIVLPALTAQAANFWEPGAPHDTIWYWTYLSNVEVALRGVYAHRFLGITWTLAIEEQFYLIWPLVVWSVSRRTLIRICGAIVVGCLALRAGVVAFTSLPSLFVYAFTLCRLDTLAVGAMIAALADDPAARARLVRFARPVLALAGGGVIALVVGIRLLHEARGDIILGAPKALAYTTNPLVQTFGYSAVALAFGALLVWAIAAPAGSRVVRLLESPAAVRIGRRSYAIYLLHVLGAELARNLFEPRTFAGPFLVAQGAFWGLSLAVSYGLASLSWYGIEAPFLRLQRFFPYRAPEAGGPAR